METVWPGSRVGYVGSDGRKRAAIVARVVDADAGIVNLQVFKIDADDTAPEFVSAVAPAAEPDQPGRWHWLKV